ncbi:MAG: hypothetical protein CMH23_01900 [Methylophaga sp.]|nr:hypothetical protein [Methylophaga sp.]|tara:strand:- start:69870 stop:70253 length:384 start_codon:yes stop_codon:yes gene_type:complete
MRRNFTCWLTLSSICCLLVGCELIFQAGPGLTIGRDEYLKSIKPYIAYWEKDGGSEKSRLEDWKACGGLPDGTFGLDRKKQFPDESNETFRTRLEFEFQRCMISDGYRYTGDCSSKYMQARPLCGAR